MSVQIMKLKLEETRDGLQETEIDEVLAAAQLGHKVTAIVTYEVIGHLDTADGRQSRVKAVHIEPMAGDGVDAAQALQQSAYQVRTGNETLGIFDEDGAEAESMDAALSTPFGGDA
ncbi:hypothetical protein [Curtobacterium flaccumfaciens]|uniref:hypothetical protein n=1 Tax=Curtobacterium flaccumfaciens TaxID=2035 RepID=UPI00188BC413|nr:hypothetical protein [Curtobacterium flaccumfaciens]MBF4628926.1 hypothetical protein [Curtobacterium flaccumfaciens]